jgi:hypothetical protein
MFTRILKAGLVSGFVGIAAFGASSQAHATTLLSDNFDTTTTAGLNQYNFGNFTVSTGSVDVIGNGFFDFHPGNGQYVDLCGSTNQCGGLTTKQSFGPGTYKVTLGLGGIGYAPDSGVVASDTSAEGVNVSFGSSSQNFLAPAWNATGTVSEFVTLGSASTLTINDLGLSGNQNVGTNLMSVNVSAVPLPGAMPMFGAAFLGLMSLGMARKRRIA